MLPATRHRSAHRALPPRRCHPGLERLEDRWVPSTLRGLQGGSELRLGDDSTVRTSLGFSINFLGRQYDSTWVNNNGYVNFDFEIGAFNPQSLTFVAQPIIAPFFADIDTSLIGNVTYGQELIDGRNAFGVTWNNVGYYNRQSDLTNTFELLLIERADVAPGAFDIEFNYDHINWDRAQGSFNFARAGYSTGKLSETFEVPGSGLAGALLDGGANSLVAGGRVTFEVRSNFAPTLDPVPPQTVQVGETLSVQLTGRDGDLGQNLTYELVTGPVGTVLDPATGRLTWTPGLGQTPGSYSFLVQVSDSFGLSDTRAFSVLVNADPIVNLNRDVILHPVNTPFELTGRFTDSGDDTFTAQVKITRISNGQTLQNEPLTVAEDGSFTVRYTFERQGAYLVTVTVADGHGGVGTAEYEVRVGPEGSAGNILNFVTIEVQPGKTSTFNLDRTLFGSTEEQQATSVEVNYTRDANAGDSGSIFVAFYKESPVADQRDGLYFDIQLSDPEIGDKLTLEFTSPAFLKPGFNFGFFDPDTGRWTPLLVKNEFVLVESDPNNPSIRRVTFLRTDFLNGTVFAVSLPSAGGSVSGTVNPPTASAGGGSPGLTRTVTFGSNAQLALALTASRDSRATAGGLSQGSQAASAAANGVGNGAAVKSPLSAFAASGGRSEAPKVEPEDNGHWRWIETDEGLLELLLNGVDPAFVLPLKGMFGRGEVAEFGTILEEAAAALPVVEILCEEPFYEASLTEADGEGEFPLALLALAPLVCGDGRGRKRRRI